VRKRNKGTSKMSAKGWVEGGDVNSLNDSHTKGSENVLVRNRGRQGVTPHCGTEGNITWLTEQSKDEV